MQKKSPPASGPFPEVVVSNEDISLRVWRACRAGRLRKLGSRLYTWNRTDDPEEVVRRNLWDIVAGYFPGALIADRTALERDPAQDGSVCLVTARGREVPLPGHVLRPRRGLGPLPMDQPVMSGLWICSTARAYLENMRQSRSRGKLVGRTLRLGQINERLRALARSERPEVVDRLLAAIRAQARDLGMPAEAARLAAMIERNLAEISRPTGRIGGRAAKPVAHSGQGFIKPNRAAPASHRKSTGIVRVRG